MGVRNDPRRCNSIGRIKNIWLLTSISHDIVFVLVPPEVNLETKIWKLILYLGGNRGHTGKGERMRNREGKKGSTG